MTESSRSLLYLTMYFIVASDRYLYLFQVDRWTIAISTTYADSDDFNKSLVAVKCLVLKSLLLGRTRKCVKVFPVETRE